MRVTGISLSKVAGPQNGVIQDHNGRQRGEADGVDALAKQSVHLEGTEGRKYSGVTLKRLYWRVLPPWSGNLYVDEGTF